MSIVAIALLALLGMSLGSFINVLIDRLPAGSSLLFPASHCDSCRRRLSGLDLVPVLSFLALRGRCRYCGAPISRRVFLVEAAAGLLFVLAYLSYGPTTDFAIIAFYGLLFLVIAVIDLEHRLILNKIVYPTVPAALALDLFLTRPGLVSGLAGAAAGLVLLLIILLVSRGGMGMGDVKLAALMGAATGFPAVFVALLLGIVLGGLTAAFLVLFGIRKR
ncbi:MAG: prepilin peptidase, partial [Chloroflexi bacterium]|nr:prepilin peptidase [Chloroflexota bacterium]